MKFIIKLILIISASSLSAKTFDVHLIFCTVGSNCSQCFEQVSNIYDVNNTRKLVTVVGKTSDGNLTKEHLQRCNITNENNWSCETYSIALQAINGEISLVRNTNPSLKSKKQEICLMKEPKL
jgi:hypothetical protein